MKRIIKLNLFTALGYTVVLNLLALLFKKTSGLQLVFIAPVFFILVIHSMVATILMAVYHFQSKTEKRNEWLITALALSGLFAIEIVLSVYLYR
jgi:cation transport ATPase